MTAAMSSDLCEYRKAGILCYHEEGCAECQAKHLVSEGFVYYLVFGCEIVDEFYDGATALRALEQNCCDAQLIAVPKESYVW